MLDQILDNALLEGRRSGMANRFCVFCQFSLFVAASRNGLRRILRAYPGPVGNGTGFVCQGGHALSLYVFKIG